MSNSPSGATSGADATAKLAKHFRAHGWKARLHTHNAPFAADMVVDNGTLRYAVEFKRLSEGRPDRVLASLSQAILQAGRYARDADMLPLAVVHVDYASSSLHQRVMEFQREFAPGVAIGLISERGGSKFIGPGLELLNVDPPSTSRRNSVPKPRKASNLFSDVNQWMLKVMLAPELPANLLSAPRDSYRTVSQLAGAAGVSLMSASRLIQRLREEGFLDESGDSLQLVRRQELFRRWQSAAHRSSPELRMAYATAGTDPRRLHAAASRLSGCIGMFAAADLLNLGHVSGVPPCLYVRRLSISPTDWYGLLPTRPGEAPQLILKQASAPTSMFQGAVRVGELLVADVLQIWLDVSAHPARGQEQALLLRNKVLAGVLGAGE